MCLDNDEVIKRIRLLQGSESESAMAKRAGVAQVTLNYCLAGKRKPSLELIYSICDSYGVSTDWLLGRTDERTGVASAAASKVLPIQPELLKEIQELKRRMAVLENSTTMANCG